MKKVLLTVVPVAALGLGAYFAFFRGGSTEQEIEFRYSKVERAELVRSISASGLVVALTSVDVRSKAGGTVVRLAVDEGAVVKKGDLIAEIDPRDTRAVYEQAQADVLQSTARAAQAEGNLDIQRRNSETSVRDAQVALETAKIRLARMQVEANRTPELAAASVKSAEAQLNSARAELRRFNEVREPQTRRDVEGAVSRAQAEADASAAQYRRQQELLGMGYVSQAAVDQARSSNEAALASLRTARQRQATLEQELAVERRTLELAVDRAQATVNQATANTSDVQITAQQLKEAREAVRVAEINLQRAIDQRKQNEIRASELQAAQAGTVRSRVALDNARVQLESTTVTAPRDGVVTRKYLEEGTIIPPGTSTFSQGTAIVALSDVTRLYVDCAVDEADIAEVKLGQRVRILTEAFPGVRLEGLVRRVNPAARTENGITAVVVRVEILPQNKVRVLPGMNATCEFITLSKPGVIMIPGQALIREGDKSFVRVRSSDPKKPARREVQVGETGNEGVEILSGLNEGDEIVTAEINLTQIREIQQKMAEAQKGGLAGGPGGGGPRAFGGGAQGGARGGAGGGGGRPGGGGGR